MVFVPVGDKSLDIYPLSDTLWRICDARRTTKEPERLLGYIQRTPGGRYEVFMRGTHGHDVADTFAGALSIITHRRRSDRRRQSIVPLMSPLAGGTTAAPRDEPPGAARASASQQAQARRTTPSMTKPL